MKDSTNDSTLLPSRLVSLLLIAINAVVKEYELANPNLRHRKLPLATLIKFLIGAEGGSLKKELLRTNINVSIPAITQARKPIPPELLKQVLDLFNQSCEENARYRGYKILAVDGSSINMPRNPEADSFVCNSSAPEVYNQLHLNTIYDICADTYFDALIQPEPQKDEIGALVEMLKSNTFETPTILIADRGYESYNLLAHLLEKDNLDFLIRVKQNHSAMREIAKLPMMELDCKIKFTITTTQTNEDKLKRHVFLQVPKKSETSSKTRRARWDFPSPYPMALRIVRFQLNNGQFETIATSLPPEFSPEDIKELYHMRWGIETSFRNLKYSVGLINIHSRSDDSVAQEIFASLTAYNLTARIMRSAVIDSPEDGKYEYKANFKLSVALCREYFRGFARLGKTTMSEEELLKQISDNLIPIRPNREDQRKLKPKGFSGFAYRISS